jgi:hypothetical protein
MCELAEELRGSDRTTRTDITVLTVNYPLETVRGNGGYAKLAGWCKPNKRILSREQVRVLSEIIPLASTYQAEVIQGILLAYS